MIEICASWGTRNDRRRGECGQIGVTCKAWSNGWEGLPPAEDEYAVLPSEVAMMTPSQISFSTIQMLSISILRFAVLPSMRVRYTSFRACALKEFPVVEVPLKSKRGKGKTVQFCDRMSSIADSFL